MIPIRIAVIALALCACSVLAQEQAMGTLTVIVTDETGARIPGAQLEALAAATGVHSASKADEIGQAVLHLDQGNYELKVRAMGFASWGKSKVEVSAETQSTVTLRVAESDTPMIKLEPPLDSPVEYRPLTAEIPKIPMQQFVPPAKPLRHRAHWF
jgi:hypothetical protein